MALIKIKLLAEKQNESTLFFSPARRSIEKKMIVHRKCSIFYAFPVYFPRKNYSLPEFEFDLVRPKIRNNPDFGKQIYLVYCTSKTNICFYILQIVGNQKKNSPPTI